MVATRTHRETAYALCLNHAREWDGADVLGRVDAYTASLTTNREHAKLRDIAHSNAAAAVENADKLPAPVRSFETNLRDTLDELGMLNKHTLSTAKKLYRAEVKRLKQKHTSHEHALHPQACGVCDGCVDGTHCEHIARDEQTRTSTMKSDSADDALVDERCAAIAREVLRFDPRSVGRKLRTVDPQLLQAALIVAYRAGRASKRGR